MKADVFEHDDIALAQLRDGGLCDRPDAVGSKSDGRFEQALQFGGDGLERKLRIDFAIRPAQVREHDRARARVAQVAQRLERRDQAGLVADGAVFERNVEILTDDDTPAAQVPCIAQALEAHRSLDSQATPESVFAKTICVTSARRHE